MRKQLLLLSLILSPVCRQNYGSKASAWNNLGGYLRQLCFSWDCGAL